MLDLLIRLGIAAVGAYVAGEVASRVMTSQSLHTHLFDWWNNMRERIVNWCNANKEHQINRIVGYATQRIDDFAVNAKRRITFRASAETNRGTIKITEEVVSADELVNLFPEIAGGQNVVI